MLVVGTVPLLVLFLYGYRAARTALVEAGEEHIVSVVGARRAQINSWLEERLTDLEVISGSQDCISLIESAASHRHHASVCQYLDSFQTGSRDYRVLALFDLDWNWVASHTGDQTHPEDLVEDSLRAELASARGPIMGGIHPHENMGLGLHEAAALMPPGGTPVGYVVAVLDLTGTFASILNNRVGLGETGYVLIASGESEVLLAGVGAPPHASHLPNEITAAAAESSDGILHYRSPEGKQLLASFATIPGQEWVLVGVMQETEALELLTPIRRGFLLAGLLTLITVVALSARTSRSLSAPLAELAAAARRTRNIRGFEPMPAFRGQEVGDVARAFNEMLEALEETERQRVQAQTLAAVGELGSGVVHEIRNRLSSVKMNVQALAGKVEEDQVYSELARIALEQVRRTEETLTELLNFARPPDLSMETVEVSGLIASLGSRFTAEADEMGVTLSILNQAAGARVRADRRLLEEGLGNLLRNAIEASPRGEPVELIARSVPTAGGMLAFDVIDHGPGLGGLRPEELFQPFFTTREKGTGLGLANSRKVAELHGGTVSAADAEGGGAMFTMLIPMRDPNR